MEWEGNGNASGGSWSIAYKLSLNKGEGLKNFARVNDFVDY